MKTKSGRDVLKARGKKADAGFLFKTHHGPPLSFG